ncbi:TRAP transporter small permease subunit [Pseudomarimonas salicorniae]|uniref:TRAP transporter small permease protein n=1 Tax=Pseudomarimonas salicorniae TaxID=2933270 RepID=A0ABT0GC85_9GAMM|nr:TRAP transporter small permease subunit [Lysobacter sp. CAU 1642]MCK7592150.1 TRAP transporter small permease subunit [Lysobacter sp. CAU 1642]
MSRSGMSERWAAILDLPSRAVDRLLVWLVPALVALCFALVVARYLFDANSIAAQEAQQWLHSLVFLLGTAGALRAGQHVRVDVLQQRWSPRTKATVDLVGYLLCVLPFAGFMLWVSLDYVAASWSLRESSRDPGGLPAVYLLKTLIPLAAALLALQAVAELLRCMARLRAPEGRA